MLARAGVRVRLFDRAQFPRDKLCGDTLNPGTLAILRRLGLAAMADARGLRVDGMVVTGDAGVRVEGRYPGGLFGRAIVRRELDAALVAYAVAAGATFEPSTAIRRALVDDGHSPTVCGVAIGANRSEHAVHAKVVIAADGRRSTIAFGLGLARHPARPRRWAIGAYFENVAGLSSSGEMHVRRGRYIGVAPVPGGLANVCLVQPWGVAGGPLGDPHALLWREIARDAVLRDRFAGARLVGPPVMLGPLAVDADPRAIDGLLLAGDAAGFIDPMTGDGLRFAVRGGELAAAAALRALDRGWPGVHAQLADERRREFSAKCRFNRTLRAMVGSAAAVRVSAQVASVAPSLVRALVRRAGDCVLAAPA